MKKCSVSALVALALSFRNCEGEDISDGRNPERRGDGDRSAQLYSVPTSASDCDQAGVYCDYSTEQCRRQVNVLEENHYYCATSEAGVNGLTGSGGSKCYCDNKCVANQDCCSTCPYGASGSGTSGSGGSKCYCDSKCVANQDCCSSCPNGTSGSSSVQSCKNRCDQYFSGGTCQCDSKCTTYNDCCGGSASYLQVCGTSGSSSSGGGCPPTTASHTNLGDLAGKACDYACWGYGTTYNICATGSWQFCTPQNTFGTCKKM